MKSWKHYEKQFYWKQSNGSYCKTECQVVYAIIGNISTAAFWGMYNVIDDEWHNNWETGCILLLSAIFSLQSNWQGTYSLQHFSQFLYWSAWLYYSKSAISNWTETHAVQEIGNWNNWINIPAHFPKYKIEQTIDLLSADWRAKFEMEWRIFFLKGYAIVMVMLCIPALGLLLVVMIEGWLFFISLRWHRHVRKVDCRFCKWSYRSLIIIITV